MNNSRFFTNHITNTLFDKFKGIIEGMSGLHSFHAVVGYFRSSVHKIRSEFEKDVNPHITQILILIREITNISISAAITDDELYKVHYAADLEFFNTIINKQIERINQSSSN